MLPQLVLLAAGALLSPMPRCSLRMSADATKPLYNKIEKLIRSSNKNPSVRALSARWTTLPPDQLVENVFLIGKDLVDDYSTGCELLALAEEQADLILNVRAYAALMRIGMAEGRPADVLMLIARSRAMGMQPSRTMLATAMECASQIGDWGAVARLFGEYAGSESESAALELIGTSAILDDIGLGDADADGELVQCSTEGDERCAPLSERDTRAMQLVLVAHCKRGDTRLVLAALDRMRATGCPIQADAYEALWAAGDARALLALTPADVWRSVEDATELQRYRISASAGFVSRAERELAMGVAAVALVGVVIVALNQPAAQIDPFEGMF